MARVVVVYKEKVKQKGSPTTHVTEKYVNITSVEPFGSNAVVFYQGTAAKIVPFDNIKFLVVEDDSKDTESDGEVGEGAGVAERATLEGVGQEDS